MAALGRYLLGLHIGLLLLAAVLVGGSLGGLTGGVAMVVSTAVVLAGWAVLIALLIASLTLVVPVMRGRGDADRALRRTRRALLYLVVLAPLTGLGLAFLSFVGCGPLWIPTFYHWMGLVGSALGLTSFFTLPWIARRCLGRIPVGAPRSRAWVIAVAGGVVVVLWGLAWLIPFLILKGSVDAREYVSAPATFLLPWRAGEDSWVIQGTDSDLNHNDDGARSQKHSWDFRRPCGSQVLASAAGTVTRVVDTNDGIGGDNNLVEVTHPDGTVASYLHIERDSAVAMGTTVAQGAMLAHAGCVGNSLTGHIHFMVKRGSATIPIRFADVTADGGVPRGWTTYTSGNR